MPESHQADLHARAADCAELLSKERMTLSVAESCTGGLIGAVLTSIPGSSAWFQGGVIAYANAVKRDVLGVPEATLEKDGAVSAACARALARGVRDLLKTRAAVSVTGIAGPGGGTETKPVGLVFIGVLVRERCEVVEYRFAGDRDAIRNDACRASLDLLGTALRWSGGERRPDSA